LVKSVRFEQGNRASLEVLETLLEKEFAARNGAHPDGAEDSGTGYHQDAH
jgi:hypothetical protein